MVKHTLKKNQVLNFEKLEASLEVKTNTIIKNVTNDLENLISRDFEETKIIINDISQANENKLIEITENLTNSIKENSSNEIISI